MEWAGHTGHVSSSWAVFTAPGWRQAISMDYWPNLFQHFSSSSPFSFVPSVFLGTPLFLSVHPSALLLAGDESFQHFQFLKQIRIHIQSVDRFWNLTPCFSGDVSGMWLLHDLLMYEAAITKGFPMFLHALTLPRAPTVSIRLTAGPLRAAQCMGNTPCCRGGTHTQSNLGQCRALFTPGTFWGWKTDVVGQREGRSWWPVPPPPCVCLPSTALLDCHCLCFQLHPALSKCH